MLPPPPINLPHFFSRLGSCHRGTIYYHIRTESVIPLHRVFYFLADIKISRWSILEALRYNIQRWKLFQDHYHLLYFGRRPYRKVTPRIRPSTFLISCLRSMSYTTLPSLPCPRRTLGASTTPKQQMISPKPHHGSFTSPPPSLIFSTDAKNCPSPSYPK